MNGNKFMLSKDGNVVAAVVTHEVDTNVECLECAGTTQGRYREYIAGKRSWSINCQWLMVSSAMMVGLLHVGQTFAISSYDRDSAMINVHGQAKLEQCVIRETNGQLVKGIFTFVGTGDLWAQINYGDYNQDFNSDFQNI